MRDDEISLIDLWLTLVRRRRWIIGIALAVFLLGSSYALIETMDGEQQEFVSYVDLAAVEDEPMIPASSLKDVVERALLPATRMQYRFETGTSAPSVELEEIEGVNQLVLISKTAPERHEHAEALHEIISGELVSLQARRFENVQDRLEREIDRRSQELEEAREFYREEIETINQRLEDNHESLAEIREIRGTLREQLDSIEATDGAADLDTKTTSLQMRLEASRNDLSSIQQKVRNTQQLLSETRREKRRMELSYQRDIERLREELEQGLQEPGVSILAAEGEIIDDSRAGLIVALSAVLGIMLGIFGAFFREFIDQAQRVAAAEGASE
ncbi:hypothetical protein LRD18_03025 [Halorhodospira halochloris]|uniref:hypothetical protein n=1 Tax=Halorhodospira halochloris TaxID=1052 RepID=UPI001EE861D0|nr:hypothetical protein [Halorhodospira halochloris]MCG5529848.1 hypothetical protein [Halorhodospira halochloris]